MWRQGTFGRRIETGAVVQRVRSAESGDEVAKRAGDAGGQAVCESFHCRVYNYSMVAAKLRVPAQENPAVRIMFRCRSQKVGGWDYRWPGQLPHYPAIEFTALTSAPLLTGDRAAELLH